MLNEADKDGDGQIDFEGTALTKYGLVLNYGRLGKYLGQEKHWKLSHLLAMEISMNSINTLPRHKIWFYRILENFGNARMIERFIHIDTQIWLIAQSWILTYSNIVRSSIYNILTILMFLYMCRVETQFRDFKLDKGILRFISIINKYCRVTCLRKRLEFG